MEILIVQIAAIGTFCIFLAIVYIPRLLKRRESPVAHFAARSKQAILSATFTLFYIVLLWQLFFSSVSVDNERLMFVGMVLTIGGLCIALWGRVELRKYWAPVTDAEPSQQVISSGLFRFMRHPIYFGRFSFYLGVICMTNLHLLPVAGAYYVLLSIRARKEEDILKVNNTQYQLYLDTINQFPRFFLLKL